MAVCRRGGEFGAFVTAPSHEPIGPIGYVDVDATSGVVLTDKRVTQEMIARGEGPATALPPGHAASPPGASNSGRCICTSTRVSPLAW